ncbi:MAG: hypothetical protein AAF604_09845 [Acidobacteriota bacterium]
MPRRRSFTAHLAGALTSALTLALAIIPVAIADGNPPPDLRLEWRLGDRTSRRAPAVQGRPGEVVTLPYVLRNVGGQAAHGVVIEAFTQLGPVGASKRLRPGPRPGQEVARRLDLPLARGVREVCIVVRLQTLEIEDPRDPHPDDNRLCRPVAIATGADRHPSTPDL